MNNSFYENQYKAIRTNALLEQSLPIFYRKTKGLIK